MHMQQLAACYGVDVCISVKFICYKPHHHCEVLLVSAAFEGLLPLHNGPQKVP